MKIYPAIDLKDGQVVRLRQGQLEKATVYATDPTEVAAAFEAKGAEHLHVVDLNGAFVGKPVNDRAIERIAQNVGLQIQVGGGVRTLERIEQLLGIGESRVILGTVAVKNPQLVAEAVQRYGDRIVVGIDAQNGMVAVEGWAEKTSLKAEELGQAMREIGVSEVIFTDIARDGMLSGANIESTVRMAEKTGLNVIASGGISSLEDLSRLKFEAARGISIAGAIIGKALYEGNLTLEQALAVVGRKKDVD